MQPVRYLLNEIEKLSGSKRFLFSFHDLRSLFPGLSDSAFKTLLSRVAKEGRLERICRGLYLYPAANPYDGLLLFHIAAKLRASDFNYISLETVLSEVGAISQVPINRIFIMSSGRSSMIDCGRYGAIEFIHTSRTPQDLQAQLVYDLRCGLWRANITLAVRDMRATRRSLDLVDWSVINELI